MIRIDKNKIEFESQHAEEYVDLNITYIYRKDSGYVISETPPTSPSTENKYNTPAAYDIYHAFGYFGFKKMSALLDNFKDQFVEFKQYSNINGCVITNDGLILIIPSSSIPAILKSDNWVLYDAFKQSTETFEPFGTELQYDDSFFKLYNDVSPLDVTEIRMNKNSANTFEYTLPIIQRKHGYNIVSSPFNLTQLDSVNWFEYNADVNIIFPNTHLYQKLDNNETEYSFTDIILQYKPYYRIEIIGDDDATISFFDINDNPIENNPKNTKILPNINICKVPKYTTNENKYIKIQIDGTAEKCTVKIR